MQTITFPLLNLQLNINKIAFTMLGINIHWYAILTVTSLVLALILCKIKDGKFGIEFSNIIDLSIYLIPISFIFARLYYVLFNLSNFPTLASIFNIRDGGLAIYGGIIGGGITCYIFCKKRKINLLDLTDYIVPFLALGQSIGRWGNFANVEAYGTETNLPWKMGIPAINGIQYVHPTFLYESIATLLIFIFLTIKTKNRKFEGEITYLYIIMYSISRFFIESLRIDSLMLGDFRISQVISAILFISFSIIAIIKKIDQSK